MRRIWFKSNSIKPDPEFIGYMKEEGYETLYGLDAAERDDETLVVTDDPAVFSEDKDTLVYIREEKETALFPEARYYVMEAEDCYSSYFVKIWERFHNLPWTIAETDRLVIRETVEEDLPAFIDIYSDPKMTEFTEGLFEDEAELEYITEYRKKVYEAQGFGIWTVVRKEDGAIIGRAGLVYRAGCDDVEVGFAIGVDYWNNGYGKEAVRECIEQARLMEFEKVRALVMPGNVRSERLLEALGFEKKTGRGGDRGEYEIWETVLH